MFISIVITIFVISFLLALRSLKGINTKPDIEKLKKKLNKNRVIFPGL